MLSVIYHCLKIVDLDSKCILNISNSIHCLKIVDLDSKCILNVISNSIPVYRITE